MRLRLLIPLLPLLLTACLYSERPFVAPAELVAPSGLDGRYWVVGSNDLDAGASIVSFSHDAAGRVIADTEGVAEHEGILPPRFVRIAEPDLYLSINDTNEPTSYYYIFRKEEGGIWKSFDPSIAKQAPFMDARAKYLDAIAGRYGFALDAGGEGTAIKGPVSNGQIPALFRDKDFLAAIDVDLDATYLPLTGSTPSAPANGDRTEDSPTDGPLVFTGTFSNWQGTVQPPGLEGSYLEEYGGSGLAKGATRFKRRTDGRFDLIALNDLVRPVAFVPLQADTWLGIEEHNSVYNGKPDRRYLLHVLKRQGFGWSWEGLTLAWSSKVPEIARARVQAISAAAKRHDFHFDENCLAGETTPEGLLNLLRDGQFSVGILLYGGLERTFYRKSEIVRRFAKPSRP
ncbi:hypothetical protein [Aquisediminimonas profunda]|uniref:hypothetical protein n=1 Tax=Aquisediminimonas profunda TaxID=1550733 RepID=UPI001C633072|nr:hypothetical protein [Aquisediminimonas profunda]